MLRYFFDHRLRERAYSNQVRNELARLVLEPAHSSNISVTVLALALAVMVRRIVAPAILGGWFAGMVILFGIKLAAIFAYRRNQPSRAPDTLRSVDTYVVALILTGVWWGVGVVLFFKPAAIVEQVAVIFVAAGLTAGSLAVLSPLRKLYYAYMLPIVLPLFAMLILQRGQLHGIMASVVVLYTLMLIKSATQTNNFLTTSLEMSYSHAELAENLKRARDESEALNVELRQENERRRQTERDLLLARDAAEAASRAKDEFLANMSHEIRTPMNGILGTLQLLRDTEMGEAQHEYVCIAHSSAEALLRILNDILDYSKIEARKLVLEAIPFDLRQIVAELVHLLAGEAAKEKRLALTAEIDPALPARLVGDPTRIRQVISNLLSNAIKFTEDGGVTVRVACTTRHGGSVTVRVEVVDTGIGIEKEKQAALFQSFTQADGSTTRKYGGTGLGLAIVRQLVSLMGGDLGVESSPGQGATFWCALRLPVAVETAAGQGKEQKAGPVAALHGRILLVEDNKVNQLVAQKMLAGLGLEVEVVENGELAVQAFGQQRFALILMDCQMPVLDGYAATSQLRQREEAEHLARTPVIAMTANAMEGDREKCLAAGMDDYLAKPVQKEALAAVLAQWLSPGKKS